MEVSSRAFQAIQKINTLELQSLSNEELRPLLPCLARIAFRYKFEVSPVTEIERNTILEIIKKHEDINSIISLLSYDFQALEVDLRKELEQRVVYRTNLNDLKTSINENTIISLDFSRNENFCRHRLIINELLQMQQLIILISTAQLKETFYKSELFELDVYINEISDVICCAMYELPNTLRLLDVVESLLYVKIGPRLICRIAANFSEHFEEICLSLLRNSKHAENEESLIGKIRTNVLRNLCRMNPACVSIVRSAAIDMAKMPALCLHLSLDHTEIFQDNEQNKSARYLNDLVQFVRNILLSNESDVKTWLKDGQKHVDLLTLNDQNKNEMLYEPVYSLACQVYNRINDLFDLSDDRIESNKELLLMFAHVFTLFNSTLTEKFKIQHEMEEYKEAFEQQKFLNTREKENVNCLKEKLEEYEAQNHEDMQKYENDLSVLEVKIKNLEKEKRKLDYEIEDNLKELKHVHDSVTNLLNLIEEYGNSEDYGVSQFFQVFHSFVNSVDLKQQTIDKTKILNQLNNILEKKLIDVRSENLRIQEEKILTKIKNGEDRINTLFENGTNSFMKSEFVFEPILDKLEYSTNLNNNHNLNGNFYDEQEIYEFEDDLTERIKQLKKMNQANIDRIKTAEQINTNELIKSEDSSNREQLANSILSNLIDECVQEEINEILSKLKEENKYKLNDILNNDLVKVNSNNGIVTTNKTNSNMSQAKLMLFNEQNTTNEEEIHNRFEKSLAEIITHSVNQSELSSPEEGETLQSILDSRHNSLNDSINDQQRSLEKQLINEQLLLQKENQEKENIKIDCTIIEILEEISKYDNFNEIIDKEKLMMKSVCSPKRQNKLTIQMTPEKKSMTNNSSCQTEITKDSFTNTDQIELKSFSSLTDNLIKETTGTETIRTVDAQVNTEKHCKDASTKTDKIKTKSKACSTNDLRKEVGVGANLIEPESIKSSQKLSTSTQTRKSFKISSRSSRFTLLRSCFRRKIVKRIINQEPANNLNDHANPVTQNGKCNNHQTLICPNNNNYLNGHHFDQQPHQNGKQHLNNDKLENNKPQEVDYDFVFCNHMPPLVNSLIAFLILIVGFVFKIVKNFILFIVFIFFLLQVLFYFKPVPSYLSWESIIVGLLEPHISVVQHYQTKV